MTLKCSFYSRFLERMKGNESTTSRFLSRQTWQIVTTRQGDLHAQFPVLHSRWPQSPAPDSAELLGFGQTAGFLAQAWEPPGRATVPACSSLEREHLGSSQSVTSPFGCTLRWPRLGCWFQFSAKVILTWRSRSSGRDIRVFHNSLLRGDIRRSPFEVGLPGRYSS